MTRLLRWAGLLLVLLASGWLSAQPDTERIGYGTALLRDIEASETAIYTFEGLRGDVITVRVIGVTAGFDAVVTLLDEAQFDVLARNDNDPFSIGSFDSYLSLSLPADGVYTLEIGNQARTAGEFLLRLDARRAAVGGLPITAAEVAAAELPPGAFPQLFRFNGRDTELTTLLVQGGAVRFPFVVEVRAAASGQLVGVINGEPLAAARLTVPPGAIAYDVIVSPADPDIGGTVYLTLNDEQDITLQAGGDDLSAEFSCIASNPTTVGVNLRRGPGNTFGIIGTLAVGATGEVVGRNLDATWFNVVVEDRLGWVAGDIVTIEGFCGNVPFIDVPPPPTAPPPAQAAPPQIPTPLDTPSPADETPPDSADATEAAAGQ